VSQNARRSSKFKVLQIADIYKLHISYSSCYGWRSWHDEMYSLYINYLLHWVMYLYELTLWSCDVTVCNSYSFPFLHLSHRQCACLVWISQWAAILSLNRIDRMVNFCNGESLGFLRCTILVGKFMYLIFSPQTLTKGLIYSKEVNVIVFLPWRHVACSTGKDVL
jgi:hypothetical protein